MRIHLDSKAHCAHLAKSLKRELRAIRPETKLSECQRAIALMMGYRNWGELEALCVPGTQPSPPDMALTADERAVRRQGFAEALGRAVGLPHDQAVAIVDRLSPMGDRQASPSKRSYEVFPIEGAWGSGAAIVLPDTYTYQTGTLFLVGLVDGRIRCLLGSGIEVRDAAEAGRLYEARVPDPIRSFRDALKFLGYGRGHRPPDPDPGLVAARACLERHLDLPAFRCWAAFPGETTAAYEALRAASGDRARRLAFAAAYPGIVAAVLDEEVAGGAPADRLAFVDPHPTPELALAAHLARRLNIDPGDAAGMLVPTPGLDIPYPGHPYDDYEALSHLPKTERPGNSVDMRAFVGCVRRLRCFFRQGVNDRAMAVLLAVKAGGDWPSCLARIERAALDGRPGPAVSIEEFYEAWHHLVERFVSEVAVPAAALVDDRVEAIYYGEYDLVPDAWKRIDRRSLGKSCDGLFIDGIGLDGLARLCGEAHRREAAYREARSYGFPPVHPLTRDAVAGLLHAWRDWLAPGHRAIAVEGVRAHVEAEMRRMGHPVTWRRGRTPSPAA